MKEAMERAEVIGKLVKRDYDLDDGADLAFNLIMMGVIGQLDDDKKAARIVAQHIEQA